MKAYINIRQPLPHYEPYRWNFESLHWDTPLHVLGGAVRDEQLRPLRRYYFDVYGKNQWRAA